MQFHNPVKLEFGNGLRKKIQEYCLNKRVLVFCSQSAATRYKCDPNLSALFSMPAVIFEHAFSNNPSLSDMSNISKKYQEHNIEVIVGIGGGSAMDVAKIASISIPAQKLGLDLNNLLTDTDLCSKVDKIDCIEVPSTAGTGSEVTPFATIWDYDKSIKRSLGHPKMFPNIALIDPDLLLDIPLEIALSTGLDALNQAFESIWNVNANACTRFFSRRAIKLSLEALPFLEQNKVEIREKLAMASLFAGLAISQTKTSICHSISYPLTIKYGIPHGFACAFSMLEVYKYNFDFIKDDLEKIELELKQPLIQTIEDIFKQYNLNNIISKFLPDSASFSSSIDEFITEGRFENNIKECSYNDLTKIVQASYHEVFSFK